MRKFLTIFVVIALAVLLMPLIVMINQKKDTVYGLDTVEVNELLSEIEKSWGTSFVYPKCSFDYAVLDSDENLIYKYGSNSSAESINKATAERDTVRDIVVDDEIVGKVIIYNHIKDVEKNIEAHFLLNYLISVGIAFLVIVLVILWIEIRVVKPFDRMKEFAVSIASGDLDKPLEMDKLHLFGAFTESFDIMREELSISRERELQANISKKELVAQLSHDIKTPVASIKAMSEVLSVKEDREELRTKVIAIGEKADHIDSLVSNLFTSTLQELEKLEINTSEMDSTYLEKLIREADNRGLVKELDIPECIISCDKIRVTQVISNIIYNSYKYANTDIYVLGRTDDNTLSLSITDRGGGVPVEELGIITQKYKRGANTEGIQGTGLGLYIAKELMENMEGGLEVTNADGGFRVTLDFKLA
ncbi:HAMP domain-containing protein [Lachnospiraceae bacterium]|nr:HAMP domain-containing protein [Lachnospiraceae bacterium]